MVKNPVPQQPAQQPQQQIQAQQVENELPDGN
jgi:hypothetical protein